MGKCRHNYLRAAIGRIAVMASLLGLLAVLSSPMLKAHRFTDFYRAGTSVSQIQRHIFLAQPNAGLAQISAHAHALLTAISTAVETARTETALKPLTGFELASQAPVPRLLLRLKIGSSRDCEQDSFL
jgi:hypothetical protein